MENQTVLPEIILIDSNCKPERKHNYDACYDLRARVEGVVLPQKNMLVPCGFKINLPPYYEAQIRPRSGLANKFLITVLNSPGTVDCVPKGTMIKTPFGDVPVEDFLDGMNKIVLSYEENSDLFEEDVVDECWIVKDKELFLLELEDGKKVVLPIGKEVLTTNGWKNVEDLTVSDDVIVY